jgi:hypothetical protein
MAELLGRIEQLALLGGGHQQITGQAQVNFFLIKFSRNFALFFFLLLKGANGIASNVPADVARIQDINRVINANTDMTRTIQSFA